MAFTRALNLILGTLLLLSVPLAQAQTVGPCHPFPGADAGDCLALISDNLQNYDALPCTDGRATLALRNCVIVTVCAKDSANVERAEVVRRALTSIGACALNDRGSISGSYTADDEAKTCYLYPGSEKRC